MSLFLCSWVEAGRWVLDGRRGGSGFQGSCYRDAGDCHRVLETGATVLASGADRLRGPDGPPPLTIVHQWLTRHQMDHGEADALLATAKADGAVTSPQSLEQWLDANATGGRK